MHAWFPHGMSHSGIAKYRKIVSLHALVHVLTYIIIIASVRIPETSVVRNIARDTGIGITMAMLVLIILGFMVSLAIYCVKRRSTRIR